LAGPNETVWFSLRPAMRKVSVSPALIVVAAGRKAKIATRCVPGAISTVFLGAFF